MAKKSGRIRCGRCQRVLHDAGARRARQHHERMESAELRARGMHAWTWADLDRWFALNIERDRAMADTGETVLRDGEPWLILTCPGCSIRYALRATSSGGWRDRAALARRRREDTFLTEADRDRHAD